MIISTGEPTGEILARAKRKLTFAIGVCGAVCALVQTGGLGMVSVCRLGQSLQIDLNTRQ